MLRLRDLCALQLAWLLALLLLLVSPSQAGTSCDACGGSATYSETLSDQTINAQTVKVRTITASGCPNHYCYCTGKVAQSGCGAVGSEGTATDSTVQSYTYQVMANPVFATAATDLTCTGGAIGIARNGVAIFSGWVSSPCNQLDVTASTGEWQAFDFCSGHAQQDGAYHYHFPPSCLLTQLSSLSNGHSPQVGWAFDGFPVYGPKGPFGIQMIPCTSKVQSYCLDSCGGLTGLLPSIDNFRYRYYFTGNTSDLSTLPSYPKPTSIYSPYSFSCYKGCTLSAYSTGTCTSNGTSGFVGTPAVLSGMTTKYTVSASNRKCYSAAPASFSPDPVLLWIAVAVTSFAVYMAR